jgi:hypothetical protein
MYLARELRFSGRESDFLETEGSYHPRPPADRIARVV